MSPVRHRDYIKGMTDAEAVEYLLGVIETETKSRRNDVVIVKDWIGHHPEAPTQSEAVILANFLRRKDRVVTYEALIHQLEIHTGVQYLDRTNISSHVKRLRRKLEKLGWPVKIHPEYGSGYRLTISDKSWKHPFITVSS